MTPPQPPPAAPAVPVRPTVGPHSAGVVLADVAEGDLVPVRTVLVPPAKATVPLLLALVGLVLVVLAALVGVGSASTGGNITPGTVTVAGVDPTSGHVVKLDLSKPVVVGVSTQAPAADRVRVTLESVGQHLSSASAPLLVRHGLGGSLATVDLSSARYLTGGRLIGEVELLRAGTVVGHQQFGVTTKQFGLLTAAGAVTILLLLFALAYAESFLRSLRKGRRTTSATIGLAAMGVLVGIAVVSLMWVLGVRSPTIATVVVCAVLGAATGVATAFAGRRAGKRARFAEIERRRAA